MLTIYFVFKYARNWQTNKYKRKQQKMTALRMHQKKKQQGTKAMSDTAADA